MNYLKHRSEAPATINCFILTVSDTRTSETDTSGRTMRDVLTKNGHSIVGYKLVPDDPVQIEDVIRKQIANSEVQVIRALVRTQWLGRIKELYPEHLEKFSSSASTAINGAIS